MILETTVARYLISTPCRVVDVFLADEISIDHAWPRDHVQLTTQTQSGPFSHSYYVVSVTHEEHGEHDGVVIPSYLKTAAVIADLASIWFGKRFNVHGPLQEHGSFFIPALSANQPVAYSEAGPFNHEARQDLMIEPKWDTFGSPFELFKKYRQPDSEIKAFWRATRFYARAVRSFDSDPEVAFFPPDRRDRDAGR